MKNEKCQAVVQVLGTVARKIGESALHAAIFAFVSKKVSNLMTKKEEKEKLRVPAESTSNVGAPEVTPFCG